MSEKLGTKNTPVYIQVASIFYVNCPRCGWIIDCGEDDQQIECPECHRKFYVSFNILKCLGA